MQLSRGFAGSAFSWDSWMETNSIMRQVTWRALGEKRKKIWAIRKGEVCQKLWCHSNLLMLVKYRCSRGTVSKVQVNIDFLRSWCLMKKVNRMRNEQSQRRFAVVKKVGKEKMQFFNHMFKMRTRRIWQWGVWEQI